MGNKRVLVTVPGDKSMSHRALIFGSLANGITKIDDFLPSLDCLSTLSCLKQLGVEIISISKTCVHVYGKGLANFQAPQHPLHVGNSGTTIRLLMGVLAGSSFTSTLIGDPSISNRPMDRVITPLSKMGSCIKATEGSFTPITVTGKRLQGITYEMPIASAQVKSCLLLAGIFASGTTKIVEKVGSRDHTERMLERFGISVQVKNGGICLKGGQSLIPARVAIPGDLSSASFLLVGGLMKPGIEVTVENVGINPTRTGILDVFNMMGASVLVEQTGMCGREPVGRVTVSREDLKGVRIEGDLIPRLIDEIPVLAVLATQAQGETIISDASELKVKESNRLHAITSELRKRGAEIEESPDGLRVRGPKVLTGGICNSYHDHRIAMALAIAGLVTKEGIVVANKEVIEVSFPGFYREVKKLS